MTRPLVFVFPGQSSCDPEMFARARRLDPEGALAAQDAFGRLAGRRFDGTFDRNLDIQLAVHLVTRVYAGVLAAMGVAADASAGLSLGEYAHLQHIGALTAEDADTLIATRGRLYDEGPAGKMIAVTPGGASEVEDVLADVRADHGIPASDLAISNFNSPRQVVVAGAPAAVDLAASALDERLYAMCTVIEDRIPMHVPRFDPVREAFVPALSQIDWRTPTATWWSNVEGGPIEAPTPAQLAETMGHHVSRPVRWHPLIERLAARHPAAHYIEVGPGRVLTGLLQRGRFLEGARFTALDDPRADVDATVQELTRDA